MKDQVVCNKKDACQFKGCQHTKEHIVLKGAACREYTCMNEGGVQGATCQPVPTDLTGGTHPLKPVFRAHDHDQKPVSLFKLAGNMETIANQTRHLAELERKGELTIADLADEARASQDEPTMTRAVWEQSVHTSILGELRGIVPQGYQQGIADRATALIMELPAIRED